MEHEKWMRWTRRCRRGRLLFASVIGILLLSVATFGCGPDFPNTLLDRGVNAVLCAPAVRFQNEIERMKLVAPVHKANPTTNATRQSLDAELSDLNMALEQAHVPEDSRATISKRHSDERQKITFPADEALRSNPTNIARIRGPLPQIAPGLPGEFADYFRGAIAWHEGKILASRAAWEALLARPASSRHFKSTWAAFMLGRSWEEENRGLAISYFQQVRALTKAGFSDSLGLASSSLGFEARLHIREKRLVPAIDLYLEQFAEGDPSAVNSLRFVAAHALRQGASVLRPLAAHPRAQRAVTAYVIAGGWASPPIDIDSALTEVTLRAMEKASSMASFVPAPKPAWHTLKAPVLIWLEAVEAAKVKDVDSAEQLALAAYQAGEMATARRWLARARFTPVAQWLQAKLFLRDGRVDEAGALLAKLCRAFPTEPAGTNSAAEATLADSLYLKDGYSWTISMALQMSGEFGVLKLARRQYAEALDALLQSGYWLDAAYVAERVLTLDELKQFVDQRWPAQSHPVNKARADSSEAEEATPGAWEPWDGLSINERIRYLLARRLTRANRRSEARNYYPGKCRESFDKLSAALGEADQADLGNEKRARAYFEAARLTRKFGLELAGTELEPDWRIHGGSFACGVTAGNRANSRTNNVLAASDDEIARALKHVPNPDQRWHYRYTAPVLAINGARLLRDAEMPELSSDERARTLFDAARLIHPFDRYASTADVTPDRGNQALLESFPSSILAWQAAQLMPNNSDATARVLCLGGSWIKDLDPQAADVFYKALVRRCRKTAIGAEADRRRWFPRLDENGNLKLSPPSEDLR